jgi:hypothetical protein
MRPILFALSAVVLLTAGSTFAGPNKKKPAAPAAKKPPTAPTSPVLTNDSPAPAASTDSGGGAPSVRGPTRIDFDDRLIQGQSNKSGAVYLYDRKELKIRSMIKKRDNFRDEIVGSLYDT